MNTDKRHNSARRDESRRNAERRQHLTAFNSERRSHGVTTIVARPLGAPPVRSI